MFKNQKDKTQRTTLSIKLIYFFIKHNDTKPSMSVKTPTDSVSLTMNGIQLPIEMIETIKSFLFYEKDVGEQRMRKKTINDKILNAQFSRFQEEKQNRCSTEHWSFGFIEDNQENLQLQGMNCDCCGNYIFGIAPDNILCICVPELVVYIM